MSSSLVASQHYCACSNVVIGLIVIEILIFQMLNKYVYNITKAGMSSTESTKEKLLLPQIAASS